MLQKRAFIGFAAGLGVLAAAAASWPVRASLQKPFMLPQSVGVFVTPSGQDYFARNLETVLFLNGYSFSTGVFPKWEIRPEEVIDLDHLTGKLKKHQGVLNSVRAILRKWAIGFTLGNPLINVDINNLQYVLVFDHFGVTPDFDRLAASGQKNAAVLVVKAVVPELRIEAASVQATDMVNTKIRAWDPKTRRSTTFSAGLDRPRLEFGPTGTPLEVSMPILFTIKPGGGLKATVLEVTSNLEQVQVATCQNPKIFKCFDRPLWLPRVNATFGDMYMSLNTNEAEKELIAKTDPLVKTLQAYLDEMGSDQIPGALNKLFDERLPDGFYDMGRMEPPGSEGEVEEDDKFQWGLNPETITQTRQSLYVGLTGFVEDPKPRKMPVPGWSANPAATVSTKGKRPRVSAARMAKYNAVIAINQDLVNRMLQLSFMRDLNRTFEVPDSNPLNLVRPARMVIDGLSEHGQAILKLDAETEVDGLGGLVVKNPLRMQFDARVSMSLSDKGGMKIKMNEVLLNSVVLDRSRIRLGDLGHGKVLATVWEKFREYNDRVSKHEEILVPNFELPAAMLGVPLDLKDVGSDSNGFILLYLNFGDVLQ